MGSPNDYRLPRSLPDVQWYTGNVSPDSPYFADHDTLYEGWKFYEISNHLGNVMATINDRKAQFDTDADDEAEYFEAAILSATDYYPFGFDMPGRKYQVGDYRYGFNGKEQDTDGEWGQLTHYDYGFRIYNPGIGRFLSVDPLTEDYPMLTPYQFASNSSIANIDLDGLERFFAADGKFLGKYGESTEMRIIKAEDFEATRCENYKNKCNYK